MQTITSFRLIELLFFRIVKSIEGAVPHKPLAPGTQAIDRNETEARQVCCICAGSKLPGT
jgi:hypothetical protein